MNLVHLLLLLEPLHQHHLILPLLQKVNRMARCIASQITSTPDEVELVIFGGWYASVRYQLQQALALLCSLVYLLCYC